MSTENEKDPTPESEEQERPGTKIYYCEICKIPCMSAMTLQTHFAGVKHKKRERILKARSSPLITMEPKSVKRPLSKNIRCLKDFMKDPDREEPLVGLEYVVEIRFKGRREPCYECQLCQFNTPMAPMIEHLTGQRHRKTYLMKHHPDKAKRSPNDGKEDKPRFLRRVSREVEKAEGLKMYKRERYERPCRMSLALLKRARSGYKPENDPVRRQKALEYMENFEITSDTEATLVVNIAQSLSEALKVFCEKKAALIHIRSLPPLMPPGRRNAWQNKPNSPLESDKDNPGDKNQKQGHLSSGLTQLQSLLQHAQSTSCTPASSSGGQMRERTMSYGLSSKDLATMSALRSSFAVQPGGFSYGINEWMEQFNQSASAYFQSTPVGTKSLHLTLPQSSYSVQHCQRESTQARGNRMADSGTRSWDKKRDVSSVSYPPPRGCQAIYPSQELLSRFSGDPGNSNQMSMPSFSSKNDCVAWSQQANLKGEVRSYPASSSISPYCDYQQLNNMTGSNSGLTENIMSQLRGKDTATLISMLQQLVPHYPDLQKINIHALAQALSEMS